MNEYFMERLTKMQQEIDRLRLKTEHLENVLEVRKLEIDLLKNQVKANSTYCRNNSLKLIELRSVFTLENTSKLKHFKGE